MEGERDVRAKGGATTTQQRWRDGGAHGGATEVRRWCDGGHNEGGTVARWWRNLLPFRLLFGGRARPATLTSWTEAQSAMEGNRGQIMDGGHGGREVHEREDEQ